MARAKTAGQAGRPWPSAPVPPLPKATGPTDQDTDEAETAREEFQAITDGTLTLGPEEMEAYYRLLSWADSQLFACRGSGPI